MKVDPEARLILVSQRNVETLLQKLDGHPPESNCAILGGTDALGWLLRAKENGTVAVDPDRRLITIGRSIVETLQGGFEVSSGDAPGWTIRPEENDVHYAHRSAGQMHPDTEALITKPATGTKLEMPMVALSIVEKEGPMH